AKLEWEFRPAPEPQPVEPRLMGPVRHCYRHSSKKVDLSGVEAIDCRCLQHRGRDGCFPPLSAHACDAAEGFPDWHLHNVQAQARTQPGAVVLAAREAGRDVTDHAETHTPQQPQRLPNLAVQRHVTQRLSPPSCCGSQVTVQCPPQLLPDPELLWIAVDQPYLDTTPNERMGSQVGAAERIQVKPIARRCRVADCPEDHGATASTEGPQGHAGVGEGSTEEDRQLIRLEHEAGRTYALSELDEVVGPGDGGPQLAERGAGPVQNRAPLCPHKSRAAGGDQCSSTHAGSLLRSINRSASGL